ncbi:hypothetical protein NP493_2g01013 [Ridgeia piscesae]|uniref:Uncharacterized protein n=1 Tax=Ridgeia piscesae TaxID=27915 RepID=A0AAD9PG16_RIDPI|nr:hypothetical protein NP493_2g01013 [Ridgeia piscesae]
MRCQGSTHAGVECLCSRRRAVQRPTLRESVRGNLQQLWRGRVAVGRDVRLRHVRPLRATRHKSVRVRLFVRLQLETFKTTLVRAHAQTGQLWLQTFVLAQSTAVLRQLLKNRRQLLAEPVERRRHLDRLEDVRMWQTVAPRRRTASPGEHQVAHGDLRRHAVPAPAWEHDGRRARLWQRCQRYLIVVIRQQFVWVLVLLAFVCLALSVLAQTVGNSRL